MIEVYWLEQTEADVPPQNDWLSPAETARLDGMRFAKRRADWRLGRWTAKHALAAYLSAPVPQCLAAIEICGTPSGAPEALVAGKPAAAVISLSHRAGVAICAVAPPGVAVGCDVELIELRSNAFLADYFTEGEQAFLAQASETDRVRMLALFWSAKESVLKALRAGLRLDTRSVALTALAASSLEDPHTWQPLHAHYEDGLVFHGWWQCTENLVRTMVAAPRPAPPILLTRCTPGKIDQ